MGRLHYNCAFSLSANAHIFIRLKQMSAMEEIWFMKFAKDWHEKHGLCDLNMFVSVVTKKEKYDE